MQESCKKTLEKVIERKLVSQVAVIGGCAYKLANIGARGFPDRTILYKGNAYFVELKRPVGGVVSANQQRECAILKHVGFEVYYLSTVEDVDNFIKMLLESCDDMGDGLNVKFALKHCLHAKGWSVLKLHKEITASGKSISYQQLINITTKSYTATFKTMDAIASGLGIPLVAFVWLAQNIEDRGRGCSTEDYNQLHSIFERMLPDDSIIASAKVDY